MLPKEFPPWQTVDDHFSRWNKNDVWEAALDEVNARRRKKAPCRSPELRPHRLAAANLHDTMGACEVLRQAAERHTDIEAFSGDAEYRGTAVRFVNEQLGLVLHISERIVDGFAVLLKRWIVERTFAWLGSFRRLSKYFEILTGTAENNIRIAMLRITLAKCV